MGNTFTDENIPPTITTEKGVHTRQANGEHIIESEGRKQQEDQERQMRARPHDQKMGALQQQVCAYMTRAIGDVRVEEYRGKTINQRKQGSGPQEYMMMWSSMVFVTLKQIRLIITRVLVGSWVDCGVSPNRNSPDKPYKLFARPRARAPAPTSPAQPRKDSPLVGNRYPLDSSRALIETGHAFFLAQTDMNKIRFSFLL